MASPVQFQLVEKQVEPVSPAQAALTTLYQESQEFTSSFLQSIAEGRNANADSDVITNAAAAFDALVAAREYGANVSTQPVLVAAILNADGIYLKQGDTEVRFPALAKAPANALHLVSLLETRKQQKPQEGLVLRKRK